MCVVLYQVCSKDVFGAISSVSCVWWCIKCVGCVDGYVGTISDMLYLTLAVTLCRICISKGR